MVNHSNLWATQTPQNLSLVLCPISENEDAEMISWVWYYAIHVSFFFFFLMSLLNHLFHLSIVSRLCNWVYWFYEENYVHKWCLISGYPLKNQNKRAPHLEVGTRMIPLAGPFPKKSSCKVLKSYLSGYFPINIRCEDCGCL